MARAAVIGWPAKKSLSAVLYAELARILKRDFAYRKIPTPPERLVRFVSTVRREPGWVGFNITIPHKETAALLLDRLDAEAAAIGAVNSVAKRGGKLVGHNTDWAGFLDVLHEKKVPLRGRDAVVFGAGGAARAVAYALGRAGMKNVRIVNRDRDRARRLATEMNGRFATRYSAGPAPATGALARAVLWTNCTPLGMTGFPPRSPARRIPRGAWAYDLVYRPPVTPFLKTAEACGARCIGGFDMLLYQALRSWEWWFGSLGARKRTLLKEELARKLV